MEQASIFIGGVEFLPHTFGLVFGLPAFLILSAIVGCIYEVLNND
jgi:hypothetical protein|tara:strand:- start:81 stop:215 length:135 start_codon:yes stop_codon:yes gene_type:complete